MSSLRLLQNDLFGYFQTVSTIFCYSLIKEYMKNLNSETDSCHSPQSEIKSIICFIIQVYVKEFACLQQHKFRTQEATSTQCNLTVYVNETLGSIFDTE